MKLQWSGTDTIEFHILPQTPVGTGKKDEHYQLELPTIETLPWNDQYKINGGVCGGGGGLKPVYTILPLRIYIDRTFMPQEFSLLTQS